MASLSHAMAAIYLITSSGRDEGAYLLPSVVDLLVYFGIRPRKETPYWSENRGTQLNQ